MSDLVTCKDGIHIIMCTDLYVAPEELTSADQLPEEFVELLSALLESSAAEAAYAAWLGEQVEAADVRKAEMPEVLSYDMDMSAHEAAAAESAAVPSADASAESQIRAAE